MKIERSDGHYLAGRIRTLLNLLQHVSSELRGITGKAPPKAIALTAERFEAVNVLRELCARYGDNDWADDLHLADVLDKHLLRHLDAESDDDTEDTCSPE